MYGEPQYVTIFHQFSNVLIIMAGKEFQHAPLILVAWDTLDPTEKKDDQHQNCIIHPTMYIYIIMYNV